jgi:hypothetical protein
MEWILLFLAWLFTEEEQPEEPLFSENDEWILDDDF